MPAQTYAKVRVSVNGGAPASGAITAPAGATLAFTPESTVGWQSQRWEIYDFPPGLGTPAGWTLDSTSQILYSTAVTPPTITLPALSSTTWGPIPIRLTVNGNPVATNPDGSPNPGFNSALTDTATVVTVVSANGLQGLFFQETTQRDQYRAWVGTLMDDERAVDAALSAVGVSFGTRTGSGLDYRTVVQDSLVHPVVSDPEWNRQNYPKNAPYNAATLDGYGDAVRANITSTVNNGQYLHRFLVPSGWTQVTLTVPLQWVSGSTSVRIGIYDAAVSTFIASQVVTVTSTMTNYTVTATVVGGTMYFAAIEVNHAGQQAQPIIGPVTVARAAGTGSNVFAGSFYRIRLTPALMHFNQHQKWVNSDYFVVTPLSEARIVTDASRIAWESWSQGPGASTSNMEYFVDGRRWSVGLTSTDNILTYDDVAPPGGGNLRTIAARVSYQSEWLPLNSNYQMAPRAIYLPATCKFQLVHPSQTARTLVAWGDSITQGALTADGNITQGAFPLLRQYFPGNVVVDGSGSRTFFNYANTASLRQQSARVLARSNPSVIIVALAVNDYINAVWTAAAFGTAYAAWLDEMHAVHPRADIYAFAPITRSVETANSLGDTLGAFRTQISTACSTRSPWATYVDTTTGNFAGITLQDGTHPNAIGHSVYLFGIRQLLVI